MATSSLWARGQRRLAAADACLELVVFVLVVAAVLSGCAGGRVAQGRFEMAVALAGAGRLVLAGALVIAGTHARPGGEM